jgi:hypothetical protein
MCRTYTGGTYNTLGSVIEGNVSSMLANRDCPSDPDYPGVTLYDGVNFTGAYINANSNIGDLGPIGLKYQVSSLAVTPGIVVTLYSTTDFTGPCQAFRSNVADLRTTRFGNDRAAAVTVGTSTTCPI